jgi:hypothetical protein
MTTTPRFFLNLEEFFNQLDTEMIENLIDQNKEKSTVLTHIAKSKNDLSRHFVKMSVHKGLQLLLEQSSRDLLIRALTDLDDEEAQNETKRSKLEGNLLYLMNIEHLKESLDRLPIETLNEFCAVLDFEEQGSKADIEDALIEEILIHGAKVCLIVVNALTQFRTFLKIWTSPT